MQWRLLQIVQLLDRDPAATAADPELWAALEPAVVYCLGLIPADDQAAAEAVAGLEQVLGRLQRARPLALRHLQFCRRVDGFGKLEPVDQPAFDAGEVVLLYCEVENLVSQPGEQGYLTRLHSRLQLLDSTGQRRWQRDLAGIEDTCRVPRRDFFLSFRFPLPPDLPAGTYRLRLTVTEEQTHRTANAEIRLTVTGRPPADDER